MHNTRCASFPLRFSGDRMSDVEVQKDARRTAARTSSGTTRTRKRLRSTVDTQRSEFLRLCRARLKPSDVGLPMARLTRNGGLRREDVAAISGVSASWYTWLEQGRNMRV